MPEDVIFDKAGRPVDCSGDVWQLNHAGESIALDWTRLADLPEPVRNAALLYVRERMADWAPQTVQGVFYVYTLLANCRFFATGYAGTVAFRAFDELRADKRAGSPELTRFRRWYRWAAILELPAFDKAVWRQLETVTIGANPQGRPSRKKDPERGPLTDGERQALLNMALDEKAKLPLSERVAILLGMGLGANSGQYALLQVQDYFTESAGATTYHFVMMPRQKKGHERERLAFRQRAVEPEWAQPLRRLINRNRRIADRVYRRSTGKKRPDHVAIPIFMRGSVRTDLTPAMAEYGLHLTPSEFTGLLKRACRHLKVKSRSGQPLKINQRRLRSTFTTNLIMDGRSAQQVADALDHSSIHTLKHYEFGDHGVVPSLDKRLGEEMKRIAGAFLGTLTERASEAARERQASSRRSYFDREHGCGADLGNCGNSCQCDLPAPVACYTCELFEPWIDAPHERLLTQLKSERDQRKKSGLHPRIVAVQDRAIAALEDLIAKIHARDGVAA
ncbi:hypothetical protein JOE51_004149 [Bradyrhizobium japonicum]|uniref:Tyr recombinase domain-containing protein n=1 Tax=Bradyrhizobium diazoefficiens TaxID=1355477 RepID=A0A809Y687_9BRAD|nr:hypothetical protein [Bradyrhizobium japonicum]BCE33628.1 hypothetical protein XF2B_73970 [Bradyrhizobium diazoefficiens]BCF20705.1 hypothetical protein XF13B_73960 [Bradyrhizobium diazoefficiens]